MPHHRLSLLLVAMATLLVGAPSSDAQEFSLLRSILGGRAAPSGSGSAPASKSVVIDLSDQKLRAYQGNRLVMQTRISSGKNGGTPTGRYSAGPYKSKTHFSSLYNNAPMPWSVQVTGNIFIHGYTEVPNYPASRGCIRVPISGFNPARRFFNWVDVGTPIRIVP